MNRKMIFVSVLLLAVLPAGVLAQRGAPAPPQAPRAAAAIDMSGYWVSVVTEDWRYRMITPRKGDYDPIPLNAAGRSLADAWDPARDEAAGQQCKAYGAPAIMRAPGRIRISWQDDNTLRMETEAGTQTRLFRFGKPQPPPGEPSWQGLSIAEWEYARVPRGQARTGNLKVVTTHMRPGYLRKNGAPYSGNAVLTEYFRRFATPDGEQWLLVITEVNDPQFLNTPFVRSTQFKKIPDASAWNPEPCTAK